MNDGIAWAGFWLGLGIYLAAYRICEVWEDKK